MQGVGLDKCSGVKRMPYPILGILPFPHGALKTPSPTLLWPFLGEEKGNPNLPAKIWDRGLREPPKCIA